MNRVELYDAVYSIVEAAFTPLERPKIVASHSNAPRPNVPYLLIEPDTHNVLVGKRDQLNYNTSRYDWTSTCWVWEINGPGTHLDQMILSLDLLHQRQRMLDLGIGMLRKGNIDHIPRRSLENTWTTQYRQQFTINYASLQIDPDRTYLDTVEVSYHQPGA